jgi:hypothetical protein
LTRKLIASHPTQPLATMEIRSGWQQSSKAAEASDVPFTHPPARGSRQAFLDVALN